MYRTALGLSWSIITLFSLEGSSEWISASPSCKRHKSSESSKREYLVIMEREARETKEPQANYR